MGSVRGEDASLVLVPFDGVGGDIKDFDGVDCVDDTAARYCKIKTKERRDPNDEYWFELLKEHEISRIMK